MAANSRSLSRQGALMSRDDMVDKRKGHVDEIHERIKDEQYAVDAGAVAEAIIRRLLVGRIIAPTNGRKP